MPISTNKCFSNDINIVSITYSSFEINFLNYSKIDQWFHHYIEQLCNSNIRISYQNSKSFNYFSKNLKLTQNMLRSYCVNYETLSKL
jgi:hypothetical protein